jgi:WD40 repeat protein
VSHLTALHGRGPSSSEVRESHFLADVDSPDGKVLAAGTDEGLQLVDTAEGKVLRDFVKGWGFTGVAFSPDGKTLAAGGHAVQLWDVASGKMYASLPAQRKPAYSLAFSPDGRFLAAGYTSIPGGFWTRDEVVLWDLSRLKSKAGGTP